MGEFKFKKFSVCHDASSMKVGVDGVLLGAWAGSSLSDPETSSVKTILDVGTGCGLIALMLAQRFPDAHITAIDIHKASVEEAAGNFRRSPWRQRLEAHSATFPDDLPEGIKYDLIVSNPPFYNAGVDNPATVREQARHVGTLSPFSLVREAPRLLNPEGRLALIFPTELLEKITATVEAQIPHLGITDSTGFGITDSPGLGITDLCLVRNNPRRPFKRVLLEFTLSSNPNHLTTPSSTIIPFRDTLTLFEEGEPTSGYQSLVSDFYLRF